MLPVAAVRATYVVALGYACADALDKSHKAYNVSIVILVLSSS